eukprot:1044905-Amphidinium_carterae.1
MAPTLESTLKRKASVQNSVGSVVKSEMVATQEAKLDKILDKQPHLLPRISYLAETGNLEEKVKNPICCGRTECSTLLHELCPRLSVDSLDILGKEELSAHEAPWQSCHSCRLVQGEVRISGVSIGGDAARIVRSGGASSHELKCYAASRKQDCMDTSLLHKMFEKMNKFVPYPLMRNRQREHEVSDEPKEEEPNGD